MRTVSARTLRTGLAGLLGTGLWLASLAVPAAAQDPPPDPAQPNPIPAPQPGQPNGQNPQRPFPGGRGQGFQRRGGPGGPNGPGQPGGPGSGRGIPGGPGVNPGAPQPSGQPLQPFVHAGRNLTADIANLKQRHAVATSKLPQQVRGLDKSAQAVVDALPQSAQWGYLMTLDEYGTLDAATRGKIETLIRRLAELKDPDRNAYINSVFRSFSAKGGTPPAVNTSKDAQKIAARLLDEIDRSKQPAAAGGAAPGQPALTLPGAGGSPVNPLAPVNPIAPGPAAPRAPR